MKNFETLSLNELINFVYIIANKEDTGQLEKTFNNEGFKCIVIRANYSPKQRKYAHPYKVLTNHANAWQEISTNEGFSIVVEADFVPVKGIGMLQAPFNTQRTPNHLGWLYAGGPVAYEVDNDGYIYGHACTAVALLMNEYVANKLMSFYKNEIHGAKELDYKPWDVYFSVKLRWDMGVRSYLPFRQYGEHGGIPNKEHKLNNIRSWHQADRLITSLAFLPIYAGNSNTKYYLFRVRAYLRGWYRLIRWKLFEIRPWFSSPQKWLLLKWGIKRLMF